MIPIRDDAPRISTPYVTWFLLAANIFIFLGEWMLGKTYGQGALQEVVQIFGLVPARIGILLQGGHVPHELVYRIGSYVVTPEAALLPFLTSMFLHASWLHVIANMWALWIFGDNVEGQAGHFPYLLLYLTCGLAGGDRAHHFQP